MLSILQVSTFYSTHGGVEKAVSDLALGLNNNHKVQVLCTKNGAGTTREIVDGVNVTSVGSQFSLSGRPLAAKFPFELSKQQCDVVHYHLPFPLAMLSHMTNKPKAKISVATWHHDLVRHPGFNRIINPLTRKFLDEIDLILATAPALIDETSVLRNVRHKCKVVPLGIDAARFNSVPKPKIAELRAKYGSPLVLFVGRLVYYKGCEILIRALSNLQATLVVVGEGPMRSELEALARQQGVDNRTHFLGRVADADLQDLYHACDVFVLPSTLPTECFGLVQVEAMLCKKPVINTNLPTGVPWVSLHEETGLTVSPGNEGELVQALNRILSDHDLRHRLGERAFDRAISHFTLQRHVGAITEIYHQLLSGVHVSDL